MKKLIVSMPAYFLLATSAFAEDINISKPAGFQFENIGKLLSNVIALALSIAAILVFLYLVWGGIQWITSGGDKAGVEAARNRITAALIGLVIVAAAYAIIRIIEAFFGITIVSGPITIPKP